MTTLAIRIRRSRLAAKFSQAELATRTYVQRSAVAQWERDDGTQPSVKHLIEIAIATSVNFEWLATGRGPTHANGEEFAFALELEDFAHNQTESEVLELVRRMPPQKQKLACRLLEVLATAASS